MNREKIHALGCDLSDARTEHILSAITEIPSLAMPIVCLPDLHLKDRTESPSSFAAATQKTIVPELTAPSVGCGMGAIATSLSLQDIDETFFEKFYSAMRSDLGPRFGHFKNMLLWLGFIKRPHNAYDITEPELEDIIRHGAKAIVDKYNLPKETLAHIEYQGSVFSNEEAKNLDVHDILPRISYRSGRHDIGYGFKGNHFLEVQYIEEILDEQKALEWGLTKNQIIIMYHGGGGAVSYHMGRYFGNRKKNTFSQKLVLFFFKFLFHFGSIKGLRSARERFRYYFAPKPFMEIPLDSAEGIRLMNATKASLNYSYAFRVAILKRVLDKLAHVLPEKQPTGRLITDSIHNAVMEETILGKNMIVHRHTANRVFEGKPVIISGFNTTNSYLAEGLASAEKYLFASDHGAGVTIKKMLSEGKSKPLAEKKVTHIYQTKEPRERIVEHITNEGVDYVADILEKEGILRRTVRLRPLAVFKG